MGHVQISRLIPAPRRAVFRHISEIRNLPEWLSVVESADGTSSFHLNLHAELPETPPRLRERAEFAVDFTRLGLKVRAHFCVDEFVPDERLTYRQLDGFFRTWTHTQTLIAHDEQTTLLTDLVTFRLKYGVIGALADDLFIRRDVEASLEHRLNVIDAHFRRDWTDERSKVSDKQNRKKEEPR